MTDGTGFMHGVRAACLRGGTSRWLLQLGMAGLCGGVLLLAAHAEPPESRVIDGRYVRLLAPGASSMAAGGVQGMLAVGFGAGRPDQLHLMALDRHGNITATPARVAPLPGDTPGVPVAMAFHPSLPLLYLWRHAEEGDKVPEDFDHLVVIQVAAGSDMSVVATGARGERFSAKVLPACLALDPEGRRLFLSNLRIRPAQGALRAAVGYVPLDPAGMPLSGDGGIEATLADVTDFQPLPNGRGFMVLDARVLLMQVTGGVLTWDTADRRAQFSRVRFPQENRNGFLGGDERRLYWAVEGTGTLWTLRHSDGYPSLLQQSRTIGQAAFRSVPVRMAGRTSSVVIGGDDVLHVITLDADGGLGESEARVEFPGVGRISVMAYSRHHNRLYIPVEKEP